MLTDFGTMSSPASSSKILRKISIVAKQRPFRIVILGQNGVGKSALTVRFMTRRFIGEYDPYLEKVYSCTRYVEGESMNFEILDTAAQDENSRTEDNIRWADAYILLYSIADRCSFNECSRLRFLINSYAKRHHRKSTSLPFPEVTCSSAPVILIGNQADRCHDRMISTEEGRARAAELGCARFYEISVRESVDCVQKIFEDLYTHQRKTKKFRSLFSQSTSNISRSSSLSSDDDINENGSSKDTFSKRRGALQTIS
ncbi:ras-related and estrogen-regulated growth inhibitor-like [Haliotis cracherodii]|uniref:ras-related and estrogen-regulated growth inhibitor-like n=1 Tax=Haliotis rufescens TaxID=6454 RepID=UPI001EAFC6CC|nr:ras-related and estrogen-regulated growth inhibitor-like [Haliotis rufescens]